MVITGRAQAAAAVVRRLNAAVKSRRLYAPGHAIRAQTVSAFMATVSGFNERFGSFVLETHRDGLMLEGRPFEGGESVDALAVMLYSIGIWQLVLLPGLTEPEASQLFDIVSMERDDILREGGFVELLAKRAVEHIRVFELRPGEEELTITLDVYHDMLEGTLSPQDRAVLLGILQAGPQQAGRLLAVIIERTRQAFPNAQGPDLGMRIYDALTAVDRLIVDAPPSETRELLQHLATAVVELDDGERTTLHATVIQRAAEDMSARALLAAMTSEQIARMVIPCLEAGDQPPQITQLAQGLALDPQKARDTMALISQRTGRSFDLPPTIEELGPPAWVRNIPQDLVDYAVTDAEVAIADAEIQARLTELHFDDIAVTREHALALLHLCLIEDDLREVEENLTALARSIEQLLTQSAHDVVLTILQAMLKHAATPGPKAEPMHGALRRLLITISGMLTAKEVWQWARDHPLLSAIRQLGPTATTDLAQALRSERDPERQQVMTAILVKLGDEVIEPLRLYLSDENADLVRPLVRVLASMRSAPALGALQTLARHPNVNVRLETVQALLAAQTPEAEAAVLAFLKDPDPEIRERCVRAVRPEAARKVAGDLTAMLVARDMARHTGLRILIIEMLAGAGAHEALPVLRQLASPFKIRRRDREVARHAREAVATLLRTAAERGVRRGVAG